MPSLLPCGPKSRATQRNGTYQYGRLESDVELPPWVAPAAWYALRPRRFCGTSGRLRAGCPVSERVIVQADNNRYRLARARASPSTDGRAIRSPPSTGTKLAAKGTRRKTSPCRQYIYIALSCSRIYLRTTLTGHEPPGGGRAILMHCWPPRSGLRIWNPVLGRPTRGSISYRSPVASNSTQSGTR